MKANELRIGNFIYNERNEIFKVNWITEMIESQSNAIPLTEEWLLKFGFKRRQIKDLISYILPSEIEIYQYQSNNYKIFFEYSDGVVEIKYVHQLQNLYFALRDEELTYGGNK